MRTIVRKHSSVQVFPTTTQTPEEQIRDMILARTRGWRKQKGLGVF